MAFQAQQGIKRLVDACRYSMAGFKTAYHHEQGFRQECLLTPALIPLAFWLGNTGLEQAVLVGVWLLVLIVELLNSGIEAVVDRIGPERHELSARAKDMGSAAVLLALINAVVIWILVILF